MQLLSTENIVSSNVHGFHKDKNDVGGKILKQLNNNVPNQKRNTAEKIYTLINKHKNTWINDVVEFRDQLTHPDKFFVKIMFEGKFKKDSNSSSNLLCEDILIPKFSEKEIHLYVSEVQSNFEGFSNSYLKIIFE